MTAKTSHAPKKFLFDTSFESALGGAPGNEDQAAPKPKYFDEDLERARAEGMAAGEEAGRQAALESIERSAVQILESIGQQLPDLQRGLAAIQEQQILAAVEVSTALIRKTLPRLAQDHGLGEIEAVAKDAMARLRDEPRIVIRVCDAMLDTVKDRVGALAANAGFEGRIVFLAENGMAPGDVRIEWADGGAERDTGRIWQDIEDVIRHMTGALKAPNETAPPASRDDNAPGAAA